MKLSLIAFALLITFPAAGAGLEPSLKSAPMPFYPRLCRTARIQGEVTVSFTVTERGDTADIKADGANELLKEAALQYVKNWEYGWNPPCSCHVYRTVVLKYVLGDGTDNRGADVVVRWFGRSPVERIEIEAEPVVLDTDSGQTK